MRSVEEIGCLIRAAKKYSGLSDELITRICQQEYPKYKKEKDLMKAIRKEIHLIYGSYLREDSLPASQKLLASWQPADGSPAELADQLLQLHASTRERFPEIKEFYANLSGFLRQEDRVLDLGCGFNPCAIYWFPAKPLSYCAYDLSHATTELLNLFFRKSGQTAYMAATADLILTTPTAQADLVFMLKLFPVLEQQKKGRAFELLSQLQASRFVVSFPTLSLSGKRKGMEKFYSEFFLSRLPSEFCVIRSFQISNELVFLLQRV
ncbi:MAG: Rmt family 16S rRNA (guanine(1405)-N(7))-methyltransferase [Negativicutes bacterium]|nr:Rmt family 16S rRNA (guanine(1405)-N(7))-methyltransferase [Negativicutes bacterium]